MLIIGLTGSIGMGKSTVAKRLVELGVPVCDADGVVHRLYEGAAVAPVEAAFPGSTEHGRIDRGRLSRALLADPGGFERLEAIVHPLVHGEQRRFLARAQAQRAPLVVIENPLLFETGGDERVDITVVVSAPAQIQRQRVLARPGMSAEKLEAILARQTPDDEKRRRADFVVDTGGAIAETSAEVDRIVAELRARGDGTAYDRHWR